MCWMCDRDAALSRYGLDSPVGKVHVRQSETARYAMPAYFETALPLDGVGDFLKPEAPPQVALPVPDTVPDSITASNPTLTVDAAHTFSTINHIGDQDFYKVTLQAGVKYDIGMYAAAAGPSGLPLFDAYLELYDAAGNMVAFADGDAPTPSGQLYGLDAMITITIGTTGTYYVNARAFDNTLEDGGDNGDVIGDYEVFVQTNVVPDPVDNSYYQPSSPLRAIDWGTEVNKMHQSVRNPDGAEGPRPTGNAPQTPVNEFGITGKNVITYYFAQAGEVYVDDNPLTPGTTDTIVAKGFEAWEKAAYLNAFSAFSKVADLAYVEVSGPAIYDELTMQTTADFTLVTYIGTPGRGLPSLLGRMSPPDTDNEGQTEFNAGDERWTEAGLQRGAFSFVTLVHELGHGHGLAHPHDEGGNSSIMNGVTPAGVTVSEDPDVVIPDPIGVYPDYTHGQFDLNQGVYTMMSYQDGWETSPYGQASSKDGYGWLGGLSAFDIAVIQDKYGVNEDTATGDDTYTLKDVNAPGTFYECIWDAGGVDQIVYSGARDTNIDLRAATLRYEPGGGGWISYAWGIHGGFTIANAVTIENAFSGSGNDVLTGNAANNILDGGAGNDVFYLNGGGNDQGIGGAGADVFLFGSQLNASDALDGGADSDQLGIQGNYNMTFAAGHLTSIESLVLLSSQDNRFGDGSGSATSLFSYNLTTIDANVAAGVTLKVNFNTLRAGENVTFNGSAESSGGFYFTAGKGIDTLTGGGGADAFLFGSDGQFTAADRINGGGGTDQLGLRGNYAVTFSATTMTNVETLAIMQGSGATEYDYSLVLNNANVGAGKQLSVNASQLRSGESLSFDGSAELDGFFRILSGSGNDTLTGGAGNDTLFGNFGKDFLRGGNGADTYFYRVAGESTGVNYDTISGFDYRVDRIDLPGAVAVTASVVGGALSTPSFDSNLAAAVNGALQPNSAVLFTPSLGTLAGKVFAVVDANGDGNYTAGQDFVFEMLSPVVPIPATTSFFV